MFGRLIDQNPLALLFGFERHKPRRRQAVFDKNRKETKNASAAVLSWIGCIRQHCATPDRAEAGTWTRKIRRAYSSVG
jgi:hypothetical protein